MEEVSRNILVRLGVTNPVRRLFHNWRNPVGLALGAIHALVVVGVLISKEPLPPPGDLSGCPPGEVCFDLWDPMGQSIVASRSFHFHYETAFVKGLMLADLPAQAVAMIPLMPLLVVSAPVDRSNMLAVAWVFGASIPWWALGTWVYCVVARR